MPYLYIYFFYSKMKSACGTSHPGPSKCNVKSSILLSSVLHAQNQHWRQPVLLFCRLRTVTHSFQWNIKQNKDWNSLATQIKSEKKKSSFFISNLIILDSNYMVTKIKAFVQCNNFVMFWLNCNKVPKSVVCKGQS